MISKGDLAFVLDELGAGDEARDLADQLLFCGLLKSCDRFVGYVENGRIFVIPEPLPLERGVLGGKAPRVVKGARLARVLPSFDGVDWNHPERDVQE